VAAGVNRPLYTIDVLRLAASIPHLGRIDAPQGRAEARSPTCGSIASAEVRLDEAGQVAAFGQEIEACAFGQASAALVGAHAIGRSEPEVEQALTQFAAWLDGSADGPGDWPGLSQLAAAQSRRARHGALLLPFRALLAAIRDARAQGR
jgi:NifU-like protein involved in Fe-S cluster formation